MYNHYSAEATLFFGDHQIAKQMTYSEFEAVLDSYVPLNDLADQTVRAVYLRINSQLNVVAAVFFLISFDRQGYADKRWNIPLAELAENTAKGPDLGSGPIDLCCFSQCSIDWHRKNLWDPGMAPDSNDFLLIKKCINSNGLGFIFTKEDEVREAGDSAEQEQQNNYEPKFDEERRRAALMIKEQRLKYKLAANKAEQDKRQLRLDHQEQLLHYQQKLHQLEQRCATSQTQVNDLNEELAALNQKSDGIRDYYENKLNNMPEADPQNLEGLQEYYESELVLRTQAAVTELQGELEAKNVEILYRKEKEQQLQQEILSLQKDNEVLLRQVEDDDALTRLTEAGINFVVYHPGAGHLSIPQVDIERYLDNTLAYVAEQCGVNEQLYRIWLAHFYKPVCQHNIDPYTKCNETLPRVEDPSQFIVGTSDRCCEHRTMTPKVININKNGRQN